MKKITFVFAFFFAITFSTFSQVQIGSETGTTTNLPITSCWGYTYSQQLFLASEINTSGDITSLSFYLDEATSATSFDSSVGWDVYIGHTSKTEFASTTDWEDVSNLTQSYSGTVTFPAEGNWFTITLDTPFTYNGTDNLVVGVDENTTGYNCSMAWQSTMTATNSSIFYRSDSTNPDPAAPPTGTLAAYRSNIIFGGIVQACPFPTDLAATAITTTQAELSWTENGSATLYNVEVVVAGNEPSGSATDVGVGNPYIKTGLASSTDFEYYVQADCGGDLSSWTGPFAFATLCENITAYPYLESFEGITSGQPACWSVEGTTTNPNYHFTSHEDGFSGRGMRFNSYVNSSGLTSELISPIFDASALPSLQLKLYYKNPTGGNFEILVSSDGGATYTSIANGLTGQADWAPLTYDISSYISSDVVVKFMGTSNYGPSLAYIHLDEVMLREVPSCVEPTDLTVSNVATTSADLGWTAGGSETLWDVELVDVTAGGTATGNPTATDVANPYTQSGLVASNDYQFYVRANCGGGDLSPWTGPYSFTTSCDLVTEFSENFDSLTTPELPNCWFKVGATGSLNTQTGSPNSAPNTLYMYSSSTTNIALVTMQPVSNLGDGTHRLRFNMRANFTTGGVIEFGYLTNPMEATSFVSIESVTAASTTYEEYIVMPAAGTYSNFPAIRHTGSPANSLLIDDVTWEMIPSCLMPTNLNVSNITTTSADLGWTAGDSETLWDIELVDITAGGTVSGTPTATDVGNPYALSGLTDSNNYEFYVRANCGGDYSTWAGPFSFATQCTATNVPYLIDFQASTSTPNCTSITNDGTGNMWQVVDATGYGFTPNHLRYSWDTSNPANTWFYTQGINLTAGQTYTISYDYGGTGTSFPEALRVAYGTSNNAASMINEIADYPNVVNGTPINDSQDFTPATTGVYYIGFQAYSNANEFYLHLDNISIDESLSVEESEFLSFKYYPNPVSNTLNLRSVKNIQNVAVFNLLGQEVIRTAPNTAISEVDMSSLQAGTYFVKVTVDNATKTIKVVKK
ncbi:fibronectin type III domain-containing protein [Xanthomarina sp. F2636L]|uniref:fibronectin type III domain-containing protein n=1 Tax=Xanthomarina sp. F2636L TaxID=2996018 RepID=UPI00225E1C68|nr:fibronectin type III domain-containing protein [Xanthomarina sp. F2636L]MCX7552185.1 fibronectin type III domain-containing protein [Xanthomarina sp. F2636L]